MPPTRASAGRQAAPRRPKADSDPLALFTTLARTGLFLDALQRECLGDHGLSFPEYSVLRLLQRAPEHQRAPSLLAEQVVCTTGAMTKLVDRLQRAGLVERTPAPNDRRSVLVRLTPAGDQRADAAARSYRSGRERVLDRLGERKADRIHASLRQLLAILEADRSDR